MGEPSSHLVLQFARRAGVLRPRELAVAGLPRRDLARLVAAATLVRSGRGLYSAADADLSERHALAEAAVRVPRGVVCPLSACRVHDLTTQNPTRSGWPSTARPASPRSNTRRCGSSASPGRP